MLRFLIIGGLSLALGVGGVAADEPAKLLPPDRPIEQVIDHYLDAELKAARLQPAPPLEDAAFLRRLTLDLQGRIPTPGETAEYLASKANDKKAQWVDRLMGSPAYVRYQAQEFAVMMDPGETRRGSRGGAFKDYLQLALGENRPWDRIFREVMLPDPGDKKMQGSHEFLRTRVRDLNRLTVDVSTTFFGVNVSCAQCHDHPHVQDWKQDHFYGMKSFFARTFEAGNHLGEKDVGVVKFIPNKGKEKTAAAMFLTGKIIEPPALPEWTKEEKKKEQERIEAAKKANKGQAPPPPPRYSLRTKFVELALEPGQRDFFSRSIVNRLFHRLHGRGLVMPLDQMHSANPASHPELLQWLARDLEGHQYDLRRLTRGLVLSNAYARGSRWPGGDIPEEKYFALAPLRALTPTQMATSLRMAVAAPETLPVLGPEFDKKLDALEKNAARLAGLFVQPGDNFQVGVGEALLFSNNESLQQDLLADNPTTLVGKLKLIPDVEQRADQAVRSILSRPARDDEKTALVNYLRQRLDRPVEACQQIVWALLTSAEFRFNH